MRETYEYIDHYFKENISPEEAVAFERQITSDPAFAEEVAFYCATQEVAQEQLTADKKKRFLELYREQQQQNSFAGSGAPVRKLGLSKWWVRVPAAAVVILAVGIFFMMSSASPSKMAANYISDSLNSVGANMGVRNDIETGRSLYKDKKFEEALHLFEQAIQSGDTGISVQKYAGLTCLQLGRYDKAIEYFTRIENRTNIYSNPGKFYHALTLMKRDLPGDKAKAKELLQSVIDLQLYGSELAAGWIKKM